MVAGAFHTLAPAEKCRQTHVPAHFQGLLQTLQHRAGEVNRRQPRGTGQKGWIRRRGVGRCKGGTSARWKENDEFRHWCGLSWHSQLVTAESSRGCEHPVFCPRQLGVSIFMSWLRFRSFIYLLDFSEMFSPWWHCQYKYLNFLGTGHLIPIHSPQGLGWSDFGQWNASCFRMMATCDVWSVFVFSMMAQQAGCSQEHGVFLPLPTASSGVLWYMIA